MGLPDDAEILETLKENGNLTENTVCVASHFSHNGGMTHSRLVREAQKYGLEAACDGMRIELSERN